MLTLDDIPLPCLHHWHGTGCRKTSQIFSCSRLICSRTVTDSDKHDTDTDVVFVDSSCTCNGSVPCYGMLEIVGFIIIIIIINVNWHQVKHNTQPTSPLANMLWINSFHET